MDTVAYFQNKIITEHISILSLERVLLLLRLLITNWPLLIITSHAYGNLIKNSVFEPIQGNVFMQCGIDQQSIVINHWKMFDFSWISGSVLSRLSTSQPARGRSGRNEVSKQHGDAGRHRWAPLGPSLHTGPQLMAQPGRGYTRLWEALRGSERAAGSGSDQTRRPGQVRNILAGDQQESYRGESGWRGAEMLFLLIQCF